MCTTDVAKQKIDEKINEDLGSLPCPLCSYLGRFFTGNLGFTWHIGTYIFSFYPSLLFLPEHVCSFVVLYQ
jgi:hypothetical protein